MPDAPRPGEVPATRGGPAMTITHALLRRFSALGACLAFTVLSVGSARAERLNMMLDWVPSGIHAAFYSGLRRGVFKAEGIDLNLIRGSGSANTVQRTGAKEVDYGYCGTSYTVVGRSRGVPVKIIAMAIPGNLMAIYTPRKIRHSQAKRPGGQEHRRFSRRGHRPLSRLRETPWDQDMEIRADDPIGEESKPSGGQSRLPPDPHHGLSRASEAGEKARGEGQ